MTAIGGTKDVQLSDAGEVTFQYSECGAGIGGGNNCSSGNISISGDKTVVWAKGASHGAGIGGGDGKSGDIITIEGGTVNAWGGDYAAGIGGGGDSGADKIVIRGGKVVAWGGKESAGIGSANKGKVNNIEIGGGDVIAIGAKCAAGSGGGDGNGREVSFHGRYSTRTRCRTASPKTIPVAYQKTLALVSSFW